MKKIIAAVAILFLAGCGTAPVKEVVVQHNYVVRTATETQKALPPMPAAIDVAKADQLQLAEWIVQTEKRMMDLESIIKRLIEFYERPVTEEDKKKAEEAAKKLEAPKGK